jgi:hypothetical protein
MGIVAPPENVGVGRLEFYNSCGLGRDLWILDVNGAWASHLEQAFIRDSGHLGLLRLLSRCVSSVQAGNEVRHELLSPDRYPDPRIAFAALLVRLNRVDLSSVEAQELASCAARLLDPLPEPNAVHHLFRTIDAHLDRVPALEAFLIKLHEIIPPTIDLGVARCEALLRRLIRKRPSGLQSPGKLAEFGLPNLATEPT